MVSRRFSRFGFLLSALALHLLAGLAAAQSDPPLADRSAVNFDLPAYIAELDRWSAAVERLGTDPGSAAELRGSLAPTWIVTTEQQRFRMSTGWLDDLLRAFEMGAEERPALRRLMQARLSAMRGEAAALDQDSESSPADEAMTKLDEILGRREFGTLRETTAWQRFQLMVQEWMLRAIGWILRPIAGSGWTGRTLLWLAIAAAFVLAVLALRRAWMREPSESLFDPGGLPAAGERWVSFRTKAAAAASRGDYAEAVRCAYWAGVLWLGDAGVWHTDLSRTPREYLRLLPDGHARSIPLAALTRRFEDVWYRRQSGSREDFQEAMTQLEALGCPQAAASMIEKS
jgi:hypothetical protein